MNRIGFGFDVHQLAAGYDLWLGGIKIDHDKGAVGHSDADVIIHAICDALLGAAALGDIGQHFPDTDPKFKNIDSKILLRNVCDLLDQNGFEIINTDCTLALQKPKIAEYIPQMRMILAEIMKLNAGRISVKATTTENLGFEGRGEGVSCYAVVLIDQK